MRIRKIAASVGIVVMLFVLVAPVPQAKAQFVIAAYTYDESTNGNYIAYIWAEYDSVVNDTMYYNPVSYPNATNALVLETEVGVNITLAVFCWVNGTDTGISSLSEGLNIMRHNVTVVCNNGTTIFSKQNFTYIAGGAGDAPMYFYRHDVILDFVPAWGEFYTVTIIYEIFGE